MNILDFKPASKFILTKDFRLFPENLVISVMSVHFNVNILKMNFKVIRAKPIVKKYYNNIDSSRYTQDKYRWDGDGPSKRYKIITLRDEVLEDFLNQGNFRLFTNEYNQLTK